MRGRGAIVTVTIAAAAALLACACGRSELDRIPACGDGIVDRGEACDDGNTADSDACVGRCALARCGDGLVRAGVEACDDGNAVDTDACDNACRPPMCGDGKRAGAEECDLGPGNADRPAFVVSQPSGSGAVIRPLVGSTSVVDFYAYYYESGHTGLEALGESRAYLYAAAGDGALSLVLTHGIDMDTTGMVQPESAVDMDVTDLPPGCFIAVTDEPDLPDLAVPMPPELTMSSGTSAAGRWTFRRNSDGGAIGGLPFPGAWKVTVTADFRLGITAWDWVRDDHQRIPLQLAQSLTIEAFDRPAACRTTCTIPRCGDGTLDGGEVCDDGNTTGGDGCAADCRAFQ